MKIILKILWQFEITANWLFIRNSIATAKAEAAKRHTRVVRDWQAEAIARACRADQTTISFLGGF